MRIIIAFLVGLLPLAAIAQDAPSGGRGQMRVACGDDASSLCPGVEPKGGALRECLQSHKDKLSSGCSEALEKAAAEHHH